MELSQLCAANYHYKRYTLDYFLESAERLGYQSIELWASGPHLHLEDFDAARLAELNRKIKAHHLALRCFTPEQCVYNALKDAGYDVISVGKIFDIFDGEGLTESNKSKSSVHGMEQTIDIAKREFEGLCFVNLVDFDALWGHRRNVKGYAEELERFDVKLGELLDELREDDLLIITADHGNDPTHTGTDHTREKVPFFAYSPSMEGYGKLEDQNTFAVIGATIADNFEVKMPEGTIGSSLPAE